MAERIVMNIVKAPLRVVRKFVGKTRYEYLRYIIYGIFFRNQGYNRTYYGGIDAANQHCFGILAQGLITEFSPRTIVDVGCGSGGILLALQNCGCSEVVGFDFSSDSVDITRSKGIRRVEQLDLVKAGSIPATADLCLCFEVAEHIPKSRAFQLCRLLSKVAPVLAFTAAPPEQGGHLHVNVQPRSYWIDLMNQAGMRYDHGAVESLRSHFGGKMIRDYDANLMVFRRGI